MCPIAHRPGMAYVFIVDPRWIDKRSQGGAKLPTGGERRKP
jgi:hypothetical protein